MQLKVLVGSTSDSLEGKEDIIIGLCLEIPLEMDLRPKARLL